MSRQPSVHARVLASPLDASRLVQHVRAPLAGAIVTFEGTTRGVDFLDYEAYSEMAQEQMAAILIACLKRFGLVAAAAEHRVGRVPVTQPGVIVAVSAGHRDAAFAGAREAIDRIKAELPIWKQEVRRARAGVSAAWVDGAVPPVTESAPSPGGGASHG